MLVECECCPPRPLQEGIRPMWEDKQNKAGGRWLLGLDKRRKDALDTYWEETVRGGTWGPGRGPGRGGTWGPGRGPRRGGTWGLGRGPGRTWGLGRGEGECDRTALCIEKIIILTKNSTI